MTAPTSIPSFEDEIDLDVAISEMRRKHSETQNFDAGELGGDEDGIVQGMKGKSTSVWVTIYHRQTGLPSHVTPDRAKKKLVERDDRGLLVFTRTPLPGKEYVTDSVTHMPKLLNPKRQLCRLHPGHKDRGWLDEIGLESQTCNVDNLPNDFQAVMHLRKKHKQEYAAIEAETERRDKERAEEMQRKQMEAMQAMAAGRGKQTYDCGQCDRFFDSAHGLSVHEGRDHKE